MMKRATILLAFVLALPALAQAQTFGSLLRGVNERPTPNNSPALGYVQASFNAGTNVLSLAGEFRGLTGASNNAHVHIGNRNRSAPVLFNLTYTVGATGGSITGGAVLSAASRDSLFAGKLYVNLHSTAFPAGEVRGQIVAAPAIDGNANDAVYTTIARKQNFNGGFTGGAIDVDSIRVYALPEDSVLFIAVVGRLETSGDNGIGLFLNASGSGSSTGAAEGSPLGFNGGGHFLDGQGGGLNDDFAMDMEVDYALALNPGGGTSTVFVDAARYTSGAPAGKYIGAVPQSGTAVLDTGFVGPIIFSFNNGGGSRGFEALIPFRELGVNVSAALSKNGAAVGEVIQAFAAVVSSTGFFSDVTLPGNATSGNAGFNANFNTLSGGPFVSSSAALPVELASFTASADGSAAILRWTTASETNNAGFNVEVKAPGATGWADAGFVKGAGTTAEAHAYSRRVDGLTAGRYSFRLRQVDFDGTSTYSAAVELAFSVDGAFALGSPAPNPFSGTSRFTFTAREAQAVNVALYDALGRRVAVLFDGAVEANAATTTTVDGANLPAGLYVVRVTGERFHATRTLTLAR